MCVGRRGATAALGSLLLRRTFLQQLPGVAHDIRQHLSELAVGKVGQKTPREDCNTRESKTPLLRPSSQIQVPGDGDAHLFGFIQINSPRVLVAYSSYVRHTMSRTASWALIHKWVTTHVKQYSMEMLRQIYQHVHVRQYNWTQYNAREVYLRRRPVSQQTVCLPVSSDVDASTQWRCWWRRWRHCPCSQDCWQRMLQQENAHPITSQTWRYHYMPPSVYTFRLYVYVHVMYMYAQ